MVGGVCVEDIQDFRRNSELIASLQSGQVRDNDDIQGFGRYDSSDVRELDDLPLFGGDAGARTAALLAIREKQRDTLLLAIPAGQSKIVNF